MVLAFDANFDARAMDGVNQPFGTFFVLAGGKQALTPRALTGQGDSADHRVGFRSHRTVLSGFAVLGGKAEAAVAEETRAALLSPRSL